MGPQCSPQEVCDKLFGIKMVYYNSCSHWIILDFNKYATAIPSKLNCMRLKFLVIVFRGKRCVIFLKDCSVCLVFFWIDHVYSVSY